MDDINSDPRFKHVSKDAKFAPIPQNQKKISIDARFKHVLKDKRFNQKYSVDKRGRPASFSKKENLKKFYAYESEDSDSSSDDEESESPECQDDESDLDKPVERKENKTGKRKPKRKTLNKFEEFDKEGDNKEEESMLEKVKDMNVDYARGEVLMDDSSSSDEEEDEESSDEGVESEEEIVHNWGEVMDDGEESEATRRLAVCNLDWDRIKAKDIMMMLSSFCPTGGVVTRVDIYPSDYGIARMKEENLHGPKELTTGEIEDEDSDDSENEEKIREKLRRYQMNRLRYYYAVAEFDNTTTAKVVYKECDNMEYESSATRVDLRYIPEDMTFDERAPTDSCTDIDDYEPNLFINTALQQVKVRCTWDETDPRRKKISSKAFSNIDELKEEELKSYIASESSEEEQEGNDDSINNDDTEKERICKYRSILQDIKAKEESKENNDVQLEVTWEPGLKDKAEELVTKKQDEGLTPWETYLKKKKEKRKNRRNKKHEESGENSSETEEEVDEDAKEKEKKNLELLVMEEDDGKHHFNLKDLMKSDKKSKKKRKDKVEEAQDDFKLDVTDPRFEALYTSHHFNIDPTVSAYKDTPGMKLFAKEKLKRRGVEIDEIPTKSRKQKNAESNQNLEDLVNSVKNKSKRLYANKSL